MPIRARTKIAVGVGATLLLVVLGAVRAEAADPQYRIYVPVYHHTVTCSQGAGATYADRERVTAAGLTWFYDWSHDPPVIEGVESVPMLWGSGSVGKELGGNSDWVMGFNEPGLAAQANITPELGAELWRQVEADYPDKHLVSPSASLSWLTQWYNAYVTMYGEPPRMDAVGAHCYGAYNAAFSISKCTRYADAAVAWAQSHDVPEVWVTEFAHLPCWIGEADTIEFMEAMIDHYYNDPTITRWAWFQNSYTGSESWAFGPRCNTSLVDMKSGELTPFGEAYRD